MILSTSINIGFQTVKKNINFIKIELIRIEEMLTPYSNSMNNNSYSNDRGGGIEEYSADPASGGFFHTDFKKL